MIVSSNLLCSFSQVMNYKDVEQYSTAESRLKDAETPCKVVESCSTRPRVKLSSFMENFRGCDGDCTTVKQDYRELHFCQICYDTCFCENCIKLVKEKKLPFRHCSAE